MDAVPQKSRTELLWVVQPAVSAYPVVPVLNPTLSWACYISDISWSVCVGRRPTFLLQDIHQTMLPRPDPSIQLNKGLAWPYEARLQIIAGGVIECMYPQTIRISSNETVKGAEKLWEDLQTWYV